MDLANNIFNLIYLFVYEQTRSP